MKNNTNSTRITKRIARLEKQEEAFIQSFNIDGDFDWDTIFAHKQYRKTQGLKNKAKNELKYWEAKEPQAFANHAGWTDVNPYEVVKIISDKTVEIRAMETEQISFPKDFHPGGFCGHYADDRSGQDYKYISNPKYSVIRIRWSEADKVWKNNGMKFHMAAAPYKFYDNNF